MNRVSAIKKIVFINRYFYPDYSATSQLLSDLAFEVAAHQVPVLVITSRQQYDNPEANLPKKEIIRHVLVRRIRTTRFGRGGLFGRAIDYLTFYLSALIYLAMYVRRGDIIVAKTDPPLISVICAFMAKLRSAVLINWLQDLFPEVAKALHVRGMTEGWAYSLLVAVRNWSLKAAATNVVLGEKMKQKLLKMGIPKDRVIVIPNWTDDDNIRPIPRESNKLRCEWGLENRFIIGYSGNLGRGHEFGTIIDAAQCLQKETDIVFLVIGSGAQLPWVKEEVKRRKLRNFTFKSYQPRELLSQSLPLPDVHLIVLRPELEGLIVPSKFYGIAAAGVPTLFIGDAHGEIGSIIERCNCGISIPIGSVDELVKNILAMRDKVEMRRRMAASIRDIYEKEFSKERSIRAWCKLLGAEYPDNDRI